MARDEIVEETRRVRDEFAKSHDYDVKRDRAGPEAGGGIERAQAGSPLTAPLERSSSEAQDRLKGSGLRLHLTGRQRSRAAS